MGASRRTLAVALASITMLGACGGSAAPSQTSPPTTTGPAAAVTPAPTATPVPTPAPSPTLDVDALVGSILATLRDPAVAVEFEVTGSQVISDATFDSGGTISVVGEDLVGTYTLQPYDITSSEVSVGGKVWLRGGDGRWVRDDQLPAAVPTLASAFMGAPRVERWAEMRLASKELIRAEMSGVDLDVLLPALGMNDPGSTGTTGSVALLFTPSGTFTAMEIKATGAASGGSAPRSLDQTLMVTKLAKAGEPGAPVVAAPKDFWLRHMSDTFRYLIHYPPTMRLKEADTGDTFEGAGSRQLAISAGTIRSGDTLDSLAKAEVARLKKGGIKVVSQKTLTIDEADARRLELGFSDGGKSYWGVKILMLHEDVLYALAWTNLSSKKKADLPILEEMLNSFRSAF